MKIPAFVGGLCVGMVAGAMMDMAAHPGPKVRKTAVGKAMQRLGNAMDSAWVASHPKCTERYRGETAASAAVLPWVGVLQGLLLVGIVGLKLTA